MFATRTRQSALVVNASRKFQQSRAVIRAAIEPLEQRRLLTSVMVNTTTDAPHSAPLVSLRDAIVLANASTSATTITFDATVFATAKTITLNGAVLKFTNSGKSTTIVGPSIGVTVKGASSQQNFNAIEINPGVTSNISQITFTNGGIWNQGNTTLTNVSVLNTDASSIASHGGGIANSSTLTMTGGSISGNKAAEGGGLHNTGVLSLNGVTISNNSATNGNGGGLWTSGTATLSNVVILNNNASGTGGGISEDSGSLSLRTVSIDKNASHGSAGGGGIWTNDTATLVDVAITGNVESGGQFGGGGMGVGTGKATLTNVTISGNTGVTGGGLAYFQGSVVLNNVTIANNTATSGGGLTDLGGIGTATIANSIIARNTSTGAADVHGAVISKGHNLVGKTDGSNGWVTTDLTGTNAKPLDPKLGSLANNGGSTQTLLPLSGSPAIDHGSNSLIPSGITTDQRGQTRKSNGTVDIGAVEVQAPTASIAGTVYSDANANGKFDTGEKGLSAVKVYLDANKNGAFDSTEKNLTTDSSGNYKFTGVVAGTYRVREVVPTNYKLTAPSAGYLDVTLTAGQAATGKLFFDALATAKIAGHVFNDANGNGTRDTGELGLGLWKLYIDTNNNSKLDSSEASVLTDINGNWSFTGLKAGTYVVRVVPVSGAVATKPTGGVLTIKLTAGQSSSSNLFGEKAVS